MMWKTVCTIMQSHKDICKTGHFFTFTYNPFGNPVDFRLFTNIRKHTNTGKHVLKLWLSVSCQVDAPY